MKVVIGLIAIGLIGCSGNEAETIERKDSASVEMKQGGLQEDEDSQEAVVAKTAMYRLTFTSLWNKNSHVSLPGNAHFSPIVLTVHNDDHRLLPIGELTGKGLELVAELGKPEDLNKEIAQDKKSGSVLSSLNTSNQFVSKVLVQTVDITVSQDFPLLSFVSMVAPSPDWIVGLDSLILFDGDSFIKDTGDIDLYALNAGTEEGDRGGNFSIKNSSTRNPTPIEKLRGRGFDAPFAKVRIQQL